VILTACLCCVVWSAAPAAAAPTTVDFTQDAPGGHPNGFKSADSDQAAFTDSAGTDLSVDDYGDQSHGRALGACCDDASELVIDFTVPMRSVSLAFGNDDPGYSSAGDRAALRVFDNGSQVGIATQDMNRNDLMDQTVSYTGPPCFTQAKFRYEGAGGVPINLYEIVDDIVFEPCEEVTGGPITFPTLVEVCGDGSDNDLDGTVDDADPDCAPPAQSGGGGTPNGANSVTPATTPKSTQPHVVQVSNLGFSNTVFRAADGGKAVASKRKAPVGTRVNYRLSAPSRTRFTVQRRVRRKGGGARWAKVRGTFTLPGKAGSNSFKFRGRIGGKKLKPGRYRLNGQATDNAGQRSAIKRKAFKIVK
jgi:hypothetical protein